MKRYSFLLFILFLAIKTTPAQNLKIGLTIGKMNLEGLKNYSGGDFRVNTDWKSGNAFGLTVKYNFEELPIYLCADILYSAIDGAGYYDIINPAANSIPIPVNTKSEMIYTNLGAEWKIVEGRFSPYIGPTVNLISIADVDASIKGIGKMIFKDGEYFGGGIKTGAEIQLIEYIMIDISLHYVDFDLFVKSKDALNDLSATNIMATLYLKL